MEVFIYCQILCILGSFIRCLLHALILSRELISTLDWRLNRTKFGSKKNLIDSSVTRVRRLGLDFTFNPFAPGAYTSIQ